MKPLLFVSITTAVLSLHGYGTTPRDLEKGFFLLTDSSRALLGEPGIASELTDATQTLAVALTETPIEEESALQDQETVSLAFWGDILDVVPAEFGDLAKRMPVEYEAVVKAFFSAFYDGRVVEMKDVVWRNYRIVN